MRYLIVLMLLAGCVSAEEKQRREYEEQQARAAEYRAQVHRQCAGYGYTEGTDDFRKCVVQVDMANRQQWEAQRQMLLQQYIQQQGVFRR